VCSIGHTLESGCKFNKLLRALVILIHTDITLISLNTPIPHIHALGTGVDPQALLKRGQSQELVFIGTGMDEGLIRESLDRCLSVGTSSDGVDGVVGTNITHVDKL
jgi:hypothetical protein